MIIIELSAVMAEVSKGLKRNGVAAAVDHVLSPLLREYEDAAETLEQAVIY